MSKTPRKLSDAATKIIWTARAVGAAEGDPHRLLTDLSRSVVVFGKMLEGLADHYETGGKQIASKIVLAGRVFWGIVEVSVPDRPLYYLKRNWLGLLAFVGAAVVLLGVLNPKSGMISVGGLILLGTYALLLITRYLGAWMKTGRPKWTRFKIVLWLTGTMVVLVSAGYYWKAIEHAIDLRLAWIESREGMLAIGFTVVGLAFAGALWWIVRKLARLVRRSRRTWVGLLAGLGLLTIFVGLVLCIIHWRGAEQFVSATICWLATECAALRVWWSGLGKCSPPHCSR